MKKKSGIFIVLVALALAIFVLSSCTQNIEIVGNVVDNNGSPVQGATVKLLQGSAAVQITQTDSNGDYIFTHINSGTYKVSASKEGYEPALSDFFETKMYGSTNAPQLILTLQSGNKYNIQGVASLSDEDSGNWGGINVELKHNSSIIGSATTDDQGNYYFNGVYEGDNYSLIFSKNGYETKTREFNLHGDTEINVELSPDLSSATLEQLINDGKSALYDGDIEYAEYAFKLAYAKDSSNVDAAFGYALTYGSTEIVITAEGAFAVDGAVNAIKKSPLMKSLKNTPLGKFVKYADSYTQSTMAQLRNVILDVMNKRTTVMDYVDSHTDNSYHFDIPDEDNGGIFASLMKPEILFYKSLLEGLSGIPQFLIDKFDFSMDASKIKDAFDNGNGFEDLDDNHDGIITPAEFFGVNFLKLFPSEDINNLDYTGALNLSHTGVDDMIDAIDSATTNPDELINKLSPDDKADLLSTLNELKGLMENGITVPATDWQGNSTSIKIDLKALFDNNNKIDDWKKLMPSISLIRIKDDSDDSSDTEFYVAPDVISRHAYDFSNGSNWLFGSGRFFPELNNQQDLLKIFLPPEIYGYLKTSDGNPVDNAFLLIANKNSMDKDLSEGNFPSMNEIDGFSTYLSGYIGLPALSDDPTDIYIVSVKTKELHTPPATGDLVGMYATDYSYNGMTEIATMSDLNTILGLRESVDVGSLIDTDSDEDMSMLLIPIDFSLKDNGENDSNKVFGNINCYDGSSLYNDVVAVDLIDKNQQAIVNATNTIINGHFELDLSGVNEGDDCEIEITHYISQNEISEQGSITFIYDGKNVDLGTITIYNPNEPVGTLNVNRNITTNDNIANIRTNISDSSLGLFYDTQQWIGFKLPQRTYDVELEYDDLTTGEHIITTSQSITIDSTGTFELTFNIN